MNRANLDEYYQMARAIEDMGFGPYVRRQEAREKLYQNRPTIRGARYNGAVYRGRAPADPEAPRGVHSYRATPAMFDEFRDPNLQQGEFSARLASEWAQAFLNSEAGEGWSVQMVFKLRGDNSRMAWRRSRFFSAGERVPQLLFGADSEDDIIDLDEMDMFDYIEINVAPTDLIGGGDNNCLFDSLNEVGVVCDAESIRGLCGLPAGPVHVSDIYLIENAVGVGIDVIGQRGYIRRSHIDNPKSVYLDNLHYTPVPAAATRGKSLYPVKSTAMRAAVAYCVVGHAKNTVYHLYSRERGDHTVSRVGYQKLVNSQKVAFIKANSVDDLVDAFTDYEDAHRALLPWIDLSRHAKPMQAGQVALTYWETTRDGHGLLGHFPGDQEAILEAAYSGGMMYCREKGWSGEAIDVDFTSFYPSIQAAKLTRVPVGPGRIVTDFDVYVDALRAASQPCCKKAPIGLFNVVVDGDASLVHMRNPKRGYLTSYELWHILKHGGERGIVVRPADGARHLVWDYDECVPLEKLFGSFVSTFFAAKKATNHRYAKMILNSLWGKLGQRNYAKTSCKFGEAVEGQIVGMNTDGDGNVIIDVRTTPRVFAYPGASVAIFIAGIGRQKMASKLMSLENIGGRVMRVHTDGAAITASPETLDEIVATITRWNPDSKALGALAVKWRGPCNIKNMMNVMWEERKR